MILKDLLEDIFPLLNQDNIIGNYQFIISENNNEQTIFNFLTDPLKDNVIRVFNKDSKKELFWISNNCLDSDISDCTCFFTLDLLSYKRVLKINDFLA